MKRVFDNVSGRTEFLISAAERGRIDQVKRLIDQMINLDGCDGNGETALMKAARREATDIVRLLTDYGADIHRQNNLGKTALDLAPAGSEMRALLTNLGGRSGDEMRAEAKIAATPPAPSSG